LDLIEVVERYKDDYESDVEDIDDTRSCAGSSSPDDDDDVAADKDSDRSVLSSFKYRNGCVESAV